MVKRSDYNDKAVRAAKSVMIELYRILGEYTENIVIVGGWVPWLTIPQDQALHVGSLDIDLALNPAELSKVGYETIKNILEEHGYCEKGLFGFSKDVNVEGDNVNVVVDLLTGVYFGDGKDLTENIQDLSAVRIRGCDLVFSFHETTELEDELPGGGITSAKIKVAGIAPFLVLKGNALNQRLKEKDAYDIYYCIKNYSGGLAELASKFEGLLNNEIVKEGLANIYKNFASIDHIGPKMIADFEEAEDEEADMIKRDAFEQISALLEAVGFKPEPQPVE